MAVGLEQPEKLLAVAGVKLATTAAEIKYPERDDMLLISLNEGATVAAVFTKSHFCAAPVSLAKTNMAQATGRALLINSGNANAGTGSLGLEHAKQCGERVAEKMGLDPATVLPFSTGVIGEQLPMERMLGGVDSLIDRLEEDNWLAAATAIMTTDTVAKGISEQLEIDGHTVTITGIAKGSGMICPDMATLLSYVATDAAISNDVLQSMLERATAASFNRITVDSDTSTNDALVLMASGASSLAPILDQTSTSAKEFYQALERVLVSLATSIIRDAEGASKFVKIAVNNASSAEDCREIAYCVAHSPLVKTALFASDPNWGRLVMAIGKAQVETLDTTTIDIQINGLPLLEGGEPASNYTEQDGKAVFEQAEIEILIDLNCGSHNFHVWTSDLSHDYVSINADYRS